MQPTTDVHQNTMLRSDYCGIGFVETSNFNPICELTKNLISKYKIKHFTYVGDATHCLSFQERYFGMLCGLSSMGIQHTKEDDILKSDNFDYGSIEMLKGAIVNLKHKPDCFICGNDFIARRVCKALEILGKTVPDDVFVVGFDNVADSVASTPKLTTIGSDTATIGLKAIQTLISRIKNPSKTYIIHTVKSAIIERQSTVRNKE